MRQHFKPFFLAISPNQSSAAPMSFSILKRGLNSDEMGSLVHTNHLIVIPWGMSKHKMHISVCPRHFFEGKIDFEMAPYCPGQQRQSDDQEQANSALREVLPP